MSSLRYNRQPLREARLTIESDYTLIGEDKIAQQARRDVTLIRCPRDGAVMRVTAWRAARAAAAQPELRVFSRLPRSREWELRALDVECPACRRRAVRVTLEASREPVSPGNVEYRA